ncbi:MAG: (5-formylfuran-3-yl)methyl phosphate synthase [Methanotrichaceae archaeon]
MKLLVSPMSIEEAKVTINGGADIVDVKNPKEGSLGANFPWVIRSIVELADGKRLVSAAIGDFNYKPGTASLAALGAAVSGVNYIKIGLLGIKTPEQARDLLGNMVKSVKDFNKDIKLVAAAYADHSRVWSIAPMDLPKVASDCGIDVIMIDTAVKDGKTAFDFMDESQLSKFVSAGKDLGMEVALAGNLGFDDLETLKRISPDIIGIRGAVCGGDRNTQIREELVRQMKVDLS